MKNPKFRNSEFRFLRTLFCFAIILSISLFFWSCSKAQKAPEGIKPPVAEVMPKELTIHGQTRIDNYYWLNQRDNPKVLEYLKAENEYLNKIMKPTEALQEKLYNEILGRIKQTDMSVPYRDQGYYLSLIHI